MGCRPVPLALCLCVNPIPPRTTQESHRPRVSDRTMVDRVYNRVGLPSVAIEWRYRNQSTESNCDGTTRSTKVVTGTSEASVLHRWQGLEAKELSFASGRGKTILLDIPLYRTAHYTPNPPPRLVCKGGVTPAIDSGPDFHCRCCGWGSEVPRSADRKEAARRTGGLHHLSGESIARKPSPPRRRLHSA